jgi:DNA helicase HerA-like ATPase
MPNNSWEDAPDYSDGLINTFGTNHAISNNNANNFNTNSGPRRKPENFLGVITAGSLAKGLQARIRTRLPLETIQTGQFVTIEAEGVRFFGLLTDVTLGATSQSVLLDPPIPDDDTPALVREVLHDVYTYGDAHLQPSLSLANGENQPKPVRSVPSHFTPVYIAEEMDFESVFGSEDVGKAGGVSFAIGKPLDMDNDVCLNLEKFVERSNGIFGKSGTGKSVLTKLLLAGLIKSGVCSNLVFDMHNEYGEGSLGEGGYNMRGLKSLFGSKVLVYAVRDSKSGGGGRRTIHAEGDLVIGMNQIDVEDILLLREVLELNATAAESAYILQDALGSNWIAKLLKTDGEELRDICEQRGANLNSVTALKRKLNAIQRLPFVEESSTFGMVDEMILNLERGRHVVVEFGSSDDLLSYMLVANIITRHIHTKYKEKVNAFNRSKNAADKPQRIMITIEEAHKFLTSEVASQTIFGTIAREMRKYYVTLLVVDQRPSSIDNEVLSQIGTRIVALINDERDIEAVFTGVSGAGGLKTVLASLDSKQQALVLGHAVPMPVVIRARTFDNEFYKFIQAATTGTSSNSNGGTTSGATSGSSSINNMGNSTTTNGDFSSVNSVNGSSSNSSYESFEDWEERLEAEKEAQLKKDEDDLFG